MKVGTVALIGRPNTGKSTLVNNLVGRKVTITSPKPQTTQFPIYAVVNIEGGQVIFVDTPGMFGKVDRQHSGINSAAEKVLSQEVDVVLYIIDHTRPRGVEENKVLGMLRKIKKPKILVINKIDKREPDFIAQYKFLEDEFDDVVEVSALRPLNLPVLLEKILRYLPEGEPQIDTENMPFPAVNLDSKTFIEENIREKAFLILRRELPYKVRIEVDEVIERNSGTIYIRARILTISTHYKKMIIGHGAERIKTIGSMARRELETATGQKIFLDLTVEAE